MAANIPSYLNIAKFAEIAYAEKEANELAFKGTYTTPQYSRILSVVIQAIQARYNKLPADLTLQATGEFMYALSGGANIMPNTILSPLIFIIQPNNNVVTVGMSVTFNALAVNGVAPITYQWQKNGVNIGGATSANLTINPVALSDAGTFDCVATDASGQVITSRIANLVVNNVPLTGSYYYGGTDYFSALSGGTDAISYQGTFPITHNAPLSIPYPLAAANNMFLVIRVPIGESLKTTWFNTPFNNGTIQPTDGIFRVPLQPVGLPLYTYYLTWLQVSNDFSQPLILT
jgi:hypothetical protein